MQMQTACGKRGVMQDRGSTSRRYKSNTSKREITREPKQMALYRIDMYRYYVSKCHVEDTP